MKHRRAKHHHRFRFFRKCDCMRCTVRYFAEYQRALGNTIGRAA